MMVLGDLRNGGALVLAVAEVCLGELEDLKLVKIVGMTD